MIEPNLLFSSNFGENVVVDASYSENGVWLQKISGVDNTSSYSWNNDFPGNSALYLATPVAASSILACFAVKYICLFLMSLKARIREDISSLC